MSETAFAFSLILLGIGFGLKSALTNWLNKTLSLGFKIKESYFSYFLMVLLILVIVLGMFFGTSVKKKYSNVSDGFEKARGTSDKNRPNPLFDIDTYW